MSLRLEDVNVNMHLLIEYDMDRENSRLSTGPAFRARLQGMNCLKAEKKDPSTCANNEEPDKPAHPHFPTQYKDLVEDIGQTAKILTKRVAAKTGLGLHYSKIPLGPFCQPAVHVYKTIV